MRNTDTPGDQKSRKFFTRCIRLGQASLASESLAGKQPAKLKLLLRALMPFSGTLFGQASLAPESGKTIQKWHMSYNTLLACVSMCFYFYGEFHGKSAFCSPLKRFGGQRAWEKPYPLILGILNIFLNLFLFRRPPSPKIA